MKWVKSLGAAAAVALAVPASAATVTITTLSGPAFTALQSSTDAFDVSQGGMVTANSPLATGTAIGAIGGTGPGIEPGSAVFRDSLQFGIPIADPLQFINFQTAAPVILGGINVFISSDLSIDTRRAFSAVRLFGSLDGTTFDNLGSASLGNDGHDSVLISSVFAPATYRFFRFEGDRITGPNADVFDGGRLIEIDAVAASAVSPVPEPATWAMMIAGFGAIGGTLRRRRSATVAFA